MANRDVETNSQRGDCPPDAKEVPVGDCPSWDADCGCHGPLMTRGAVAWAAGSAGGPDFFVDMYDKPAKFWGTQHTNFGMINDKESFAVIERILDTPATNRNGMHVMDRVVAFKMSLE